MINFAYNQVIGYIRNVKKFVVDRFFFGLFGLSRIIWNLRYIGISSFAE